MSQDNFADIIPYGDLGIIALESSRAIGEKVDNYVSSWRNESRNDEESIHFIEICLRAIVGQYDK